MSDLGAPPSRSKFMHTAITTVILIVVLYGIAFSTPTLRHISDGVDTVQKLLLEPKPEPDEVEVRDASAAALLDPNDDYYKPPMWSCQDTDRKKKLVFVHIFKTAGSSMRSLLSSYARSCHAGCATVVNCGATRLDSIQNGNWEKDEEYRSRFHGTMCKLKKTVFRNNTSTVYAETGIDVPINNTYLKEAQIDIISGHVSVGTDHGWTDDKGKHVDVQYLTFFRESKRKFVSAVLFLRKDMTFDEAVARVKEAAKDRLAKGKYLSNIASIMTPAQRGDFRKRNVTLSAEQEANLMIQNLKEKNILVGIVERMSESLEMLQHVIDKDGELDELFEKFGKIPPGANATKEVIRNKSRLSSSEVLKEVEKDEEFMKVMEEFVKWDEKVYKFAFDVHMRQYEAFSKRRPSQIAARPKPVEQLAFEVDPDDDSDLDSASSSDSQSGPLSSAVKLDGEATIEISSLSDDIDVGLEPMWSCRDTDRQKKFVFVHIFKTAGSSMRTLLSNYAEKCNAANAVVVNCAPVDPATIETGNWAKNEKDRSRKHGSACKLKKTVYRNNTVVVHSSGRGGEVPMNTTYLENSKVDILGGHITMGIDQYWKDYEGNHVDVQYLTFFRESTQKVVSAVLFMNPKLSFEEAVERTKDRVRTAARKSEYLDNSNYIITPAQMSKLENTKLSPALKAELMLETLKENKVLFGIVERMSESLEMLQHVIDKDRDLDELFESFGMIPPGTNTTKEVIKNKSKLSSSEVLAEVEKDEEFMKLFREYVKYDTMVYKFALDMHLHQYEIFQEQKPTRHPKLTKPLDPKVFRVEESQADSVPSTQRLDKHTTQQPETIEAKSQTTSKVKLDQEAIVDIIPPNVDKDLMVEPMWSCRDTDRQKKFVFVHIFKTAGSSMRTLLSNYAKQCNAANAVVVNCAPVDPATIETGNWAKNEKDRSLKYGSACQLKKTVHRNNTVVLHSSPSPINTTYLEEAKVDILDGHITLGTDQYWNNDEGNHVDVQYLTFFRESTQKVVSATLYLNPKLTFDEAVEKTKDRVRKAVAKSEYLDNSNYIITPAKVSKLVNTSITPDTTAKLMIETLKENKVLFGIVERMPESLEMLQHVIDKDRDLDDLFVSFGMNPPGSNKTKEVIKNKSKLSSSEVLAEVEKDEEFMKLFREYVKYDTTVYKFALDMHMRQYEAFVKQNLPITK